MDVSEGEEEEEVVTLPTDKYKPASLDKMITLIASLVEKSRDTDLRLKLSTKDYNAVAGGKVIKTLSLSLKWYIFFFALWKPYDRETSENQQCVSFLYLILLFLVPFGLNSRSLYNLC